jgi:hypothetical protein
MTTEPKGEKVSEGFNEWAIVELMGHRKLAGKVSEQTIASAAFLRIDVPEQDERPAATQFYSAGAVYAITPCTEQTARDSMAAMSAVAPVSRWELPQRIEAPKVDSSAVDDDDDDDGSEPRQYGANF